MTWNDVLDLLKPIVTNQWTVMLLILAVATTAFVFLFVAWREFFAWYFRTKHILDELKMLKNEISELRNYLEDSRVQGGSKYQNSDVTMNLEFSEKPQEKGPFVFNNSEQPAFSNTIESLNSNKSFSLRNPKTPKEEQFPVR